MSDVTARRNRVNKADLISMVGRQFGSLTVVNLVKPDKWGASRFECSCSCGSITIIQASRVNRGLTKSCYKCSRKGKMTHGLSNTPLYLVWNNIKARIFNTSNPEYKNYGGRGISICQEWNNSFEIFSAWALQNGWKRGLQIDRRNNDESYSPDNCRIVPGVVNIRNRRLTKKVEYKGANIPLAELCENLQLKYSVIHSRLKRGWDLNKAITFNTVSI